MNHDTTLSTAPASGDEAPQARVEEQRQALLGRIDALREVGALPTPRRRWAAASVAQWSNWSNG